MVFRQDLAQKFREEQLAHPTAKLRSPENVVEGRYILTDIHHGLRGMLQNAEPVLDIPHDLPVIQLVLLEKLGVLFHLVVHLAGERVDLVLKRSVKAVKFLLKLQERLEGLISFRRPLGQTLKKPKSRGKKTERHRDREQDQKRRIHERIILKGPGFSYSERLKTNNAQRRKHVL
jgi:hypothetical protein